MKALTAGLLLLPVALFAQEPLKIGNILFSGSMRTRVESWNWFDAGPGSENTYTFPGSIARLALSKSRAGFDWQIEFAAPILLHLPQNSVAAGAPGQLGMGASYFAANNRAANAGMAFAKQAFARWKFAEGATKQTLRIGRFEFLDGAEVAPEDATLRALKRDRIAQRLIGAFGYTDVGRSMDGAEYSLTRGRGNVTLTAFRPTRGVFQVDGWGEVNVNVIYGAWTRAFRGKSAGELRVFGAGYFDDRDNVLKTDNRALAARRPDAGHLRIGTYGGHYLRVAPTAAGTFYGLLWGVAQTGSWGALTQRSYAWAAEGGWQPAPSSLRLVKTLKPWLRGGVDYGSGDRNPGDSVHGTFFQLLPTPRPYARMPFFNMMNLRDAFGELILRPGKSVTIRGDIHSLRLAQSADLWYSGGGAFQPWTFGYTGRASGGQSGLATLIDTSADWAVSPHFSFGAYVAHASGKLVMQSIYPRGRNANFGYLELTYRF